MKRIALLGASGSIGRNTLEVISNYPEKFKVSLLSVHTQVDFAVEKAQELKPEAVIFTDNNDVYDAIDLLEKQNIAVYIGDDGLEEALKNCHYDLLVNSLVGGIGLVPTLTAIQQGKPVALANKETMVMAGELVNSELDKHNVSLIPIDSEHSAIFQSLRAGNANEISKIILTASGGPFYDLPKEKLSSVTRDQALKHPTWEMGKKITIDSATLMNKALEIIEAKWLFDLDVSQIEVVVHPQSIIHSMVEFCDGSVIAQMGLPDMRVPIQFAITYPERKPVNVGRLDLTKVENLVFKSPDTDKFPSLTLGYEAAKIGGTMGSTLNAANEVAVDAFLNNQIKFTDITKLVKMAMMNHTVINNPTLDDVIASDSWARQEVYKCIS
ncbi:1-deoxy-D-xylulose-5-phosphate reductoisomerase [candidate division KSB1 bacterium]|nr:1-deoxy-D-xylulose-5-phosphate reductoisomerase [candidate division KSB1 bacterium]